MSNRKPKRPGRLNKPEHHFITPQFNADGKLKMEGRVQIFKSFESATEILREVTYHPNKGYKVRRVA